LGKVCQPALIFQGKMDGTIDPQGAVTVLDALGSREKQIVWLERSRHTLLLGPEHQNVFRQTLAFIQQATI
jgi:carboxylesterase